MSTGEHPVPRIDFYVLPDAKPRGRQLLACRLAEKAYLQGYRVYIHAGSHAQAALIDELLWTFKDDGFIPHGLDGDPAAAAAPVLVGDGSGAPAAGAQVLINLDDAVPAFFDRFERVTELVDQSAEVKERARLRFRAYRERGYAPHSHQL